MSLGESGKVDSGVAGYFSMQVVGKLEILGLGGGVEEDVDGQGFILQLHGEGDGVGMVGPAGVIQLHAMQVFLDWWIS